MSYALSSYLPKQFEQYLRIWEILPVSTIEFKFCQNQTKNASKGKKIKVIHVFNTFFYKKLAVSVGPSKPVLFRQRYLAFEKKHVIVPKELSRTGLFKLQQSECVVLTIVSSLLSKRVFLFCLG